jgi:tetratricopeptide (TPR) repeat protein
MSRKWITALKQLNNVQYIPDGTGKKIPLLTKPIDIESVKDLENDELQDIFFRTLEPILDVHEEYIPKKLIDMYWIIHEKRRLSELSSDGSGTGVIPEQQINCPVCGKTIVNFADESGEVFSACSHVALVYTRFSDYNIYDESLECIVENMSRFLEETDEDGEYNIEDLLSTDLSYDNDPLLNLLLTFAYDSGEKFKIYVIDDPDPLPPAYETYIFLIRMTEDKTEIDNYLVDTYKKQAQAFIKRRKYQYAVDALIESQDIQPEEEINALLIDAYNKIIRINPKDADAFYGRGNAYLDLNQYDNAIKDYSEAIQLKPDNVDAYYNRGIAYRILKKYQLAIEDFNEFIRIRPDDAIGYYSRGMAYDDFEKYDLAIKDYNEYIRMKPDDAMTYFERGLAYGNLEQYQMAIADFDEYIHISPDDADAYNNRGLCYYRLGQLQHAIEDYNEAIRLNPDQSPFYKNRGLAYEELGQPQCANEDYDKANKIKKDSEATSKK